MKYVLMHPLPSRIVHWWNMLCIVILTLTGFYIHDPNFLPFLGPMDLARKWHFIFMYGVVCGLSFRAIYGGLTGANRDLLFRFRDISGLWPLTKYYLFLSKTYDPGEKYNPGQKMVYTLWPVLLIVQAITGFILYWPLESAGLAQYFGGEMKVRMIHYYITWVFGCSASVHIYMALLSGRDVVKSMINGYLPEGKH